MTIRVKTTTPVAARTGGFTLIELLVVIAIIALLMSILMPALQRVKKEARAVVCQSKLREWGFVWAMYTGDNRGRFPSYLGDRWMDRVREFYANTDSLLFCPMATKTREQGAAIRYAAIAEDVGSYAMNEWIYDSSDTSGGRDLKDYWRSTNAKGLYDAPVMGDAAWRADGQPNDTDEPPQFEGEPRSGMNNDEMRIFCIPRHDDSVNILFADWSIREVGLKGLWHIKWNQSFDTSVSPNWPEWMRNFSDRK